MKNGSEWYKREPVAYLGGVQGFSAKEHAVFSVVLDLIYQHGGSINNDARWIAGWISDMGPAAVRSTLSNLSERGKLTLSDTSITQKRAANEAKTKDAVRETARENGKKGGEKSAKSRAASSKSNCLDEAGASHDIQAEEKRGDKISEIDKSISSQEVAAYQTYLKAHPKPVESDKGYNQFVRLIAEGTDAEQIVNAAKEYARKVKGWSPEAKIQQSDNFLDPERGKWRDHCVSGTKAATETEILDYYSPFVVNKDPLASKIVGSQMAQKLVDAGRVSIDQLGAVGIRLP